MREMPGLEISDKKIQSGPNTASILSTHSLSIVTSIWAALTTLSITNSAGMQVYPDRSGYP